MIAQAGLGTSHIDGNTRLCTATASQALRETFGSDGQPGSYTDFDVDRLPAPGRPQHGRDADRAVGARPRPPSRAEAAEARRHRPAADADGRGGRRPPRARARARTSRCSTACCTCSSRPGTIDREFIDEHTVGFEQLARGRRGLPAGAGRGDHRRPGRRSSARRRRSDRQRARRWSRPSSRASTSRTRRPPRPAR